MEDKYTPASVSDESFKVLNDEKSDMRSSDDTGTPSPYPDPNKFIDLEKGNGSSQKPLQGSTNDTGSGSETNKVWWKNFFAGFANIVIFLHAVFLFIAHVYKVHRYSKVCYIMSGGSIGSILGFLFTTLLTYPKWSSQPRKPVKNVFMDMLATIIYASILIIFGITMYCIAKRAIGFEEVDEDTMFYVVYFAYVFLSFILWMNEAMRDRLGSFYFYIMCGIGGFIIFYGGCLIICGAVIKARGNLPDDMFEPKNQRGTTSKRETKLQPLDKQSAKV